MAGWLFPPPPSAWYGKRYMSLNLILLLCVL